MSCNPLSHDIISIAAILLSGTLPCAYTEVSPIFSFNSFKAPSLMLTCPIHWTDFCVRREPPARGLQESLHCLLKRLSFTAWLWYWHQESSGYSCADVFWVPCPSPLICMSPVSLADVGLHILVTCRPIKHLVRGSAWLFWGGDWCRTWGGRRLNSKFSSLQLTIW